MIRKIVPHNSILVYILFLQSDQLERYIPKALVYALLWAMAGDGKLKVRQELGDFIRGVTTIPLPAQQTMPIIDFEVSRSNIEITVVCLYIIKMCQFKRRSAYTLPVMCTGQLLVPSDH